MSTHKMIKSHRFFKIIYLALVVTFISLDISYAYPPEHNPGNSTLATPSLLQQQPINEHMARFQQSVFSQGALLASVYDIGEYFFGRPERKIESLPSKYAEEVVRAGLGKILGDSGIEILNIVPVEYLKTTVPEKLNSALSEIGFKGALPDEGVIFILYKKDGKKFLVQIAEKAKVSAGNLPGYEWVVSDKYVVKYIPEGYEEGKLQSSLRGSKATEAISPLEVIKEAQKTIISEPLAEIKTLATEGADLTQESKRTFTIRAIIASLALVVLTALPVFAVEPQKATFPQSIFNALEGFAFAHPIIAGIATLGIGIAAFFVIWRVFFPVSWHLFWFRWGLDSSAQLVHKEALVKIGPRSIRALIKELRHKNGLAEPVLAAEVFGEIKDPRSVEPLIKALSDRDWSVRIKAADALGNIRDIRAIDPLIEALSRSDGGGHYTGALVKIGTPAIPSLIKSLDDANHKVRFDAADILDKIGWKPTTPELNIAYLSAKREVDALAEIGIASVPRLIETLNVDWYGSRSFGKALVKIGAPAVPSLIKALGDPGCHVRSEAAVILGEIKDPRAVEPLIKALSYGFGIRDNTIWALAEIGSPAVPALIKALDNENSGVRFCAARALIKIKDPRAVEPLIKAGNTVIVLSDAVEAFGEMKDPRTVEFLMKALSDRDCHVRAKAAYSLGEIKDPRAVEPLIEALGDSYDFVSSEASGALAKIGKPAVSFLIKALGYRDSGMRAKVAYVLGNIGDPIAVEPLMKTSNDNDWNVRDKTMGALVKIGAPAVPSLIKALDHKDISVVRAEAAAEALGEIRDLRAVEPLIKALGKAFDDRNDSMLANAADALGKIKDPRAVGPLIKVLECHIYIGRRVADALVKIGSPSLYPLIKALGNHSCDVRNLAAGALIEMKDPRLDFMKDYLRIVSTWRNDMGYIVLTDEEINYILEGLNNNAKIEGQYVPYIPNTSKARFIIKMDKTVLPRGEKQNDTATLMFVNPFAAAFIASILGAVFSAAKGFAFAHPIITVGIVLAFVVIAWRIVDGLRRTFFPVETNLRDLIHKKDLRAEKYFMKAESSVIPALIEAFHRGNSDTRKSIAKILVMRKDRHITEPFIKLLLKDSDLGVRMVTLRELIRAKDPLAIEPLVETLSDMKRAGYVLRYLYDTKARNPILIDPLAKVLSEAPEPRIRKRAISILEDIEDIRVVGLLIKVLKKDKDRGVLYDALLALTNIKRSKIKDSIDPEHKSILEFIDEAKSRLVKKVKTHMPNHERHMINARFIYRVVCPIMRITKDLTDARIALKLALDLCPSKVTVDVTGTEKRYRYDLTEAIALVNNKELLHSKIAEYKAELLQKHAQTSKATQLFEIVESSLNSNRERFISAGNRLIGSIPAKSFSEIAVKNINALDGNMTTAEIRQRVEKAITVIESSDAEGIAPEVKTAIGLLKKDLNQFEADGAVGSLIVLARRAKRENQKLIIGLETDWIPGVNIKKSCQKQAIFALMKEIDAIGDALKSMGLDNVEIIRGSGKDLADTLLGEAEKTRTNLRNIVVMASSDTINSASFAALRNADENDRPFIAGIDPTELIKLYSEFGETTGNQLYVRLTQLLCITLELAAGKEPPHTPMIVSYDKKMRIVIFLPKAEPLDYELLKKAYAAEKAALAAA